MPLSPYAYRHRKCRHHSTRITIAIIAAGEGNVAEVGCDPIMLRCVQYCHRSCYAMSSTAIGHATLCPVLHKDMLCHVRLSCSCAVRYWRRLCCYACAMGCAVLAPAMLLRVRYGVCGTDAGYAATKVERLLAQSAENVNAPGTGLRLWLRPPFMAVLLPPFMAALPPAVCSRFSCQCCRAPA
eukprot:3266973-Rhodomonas_salina.2